MGARLTADELRCGTALTNVWCLLDNSCLICKTTKYIYLSSGSRGFLANKYRCSLSLECICQQMKSFLRQMTPQRRVYTDNYAIWLQRVGRRENTSVYVCLRGRHAGKNIREADVLHFADDCSRRVQLFELVRLTRANRFWWPMCNRKYHLRGLNVYIYSLKFTIK